ncbi:MAG: hypothetical protein AAFN81_21130 [Bacteroidota bacterium]
MRVLLLLILISLSYTTKAQIETAPRQSWPIVVTVQFHAFSVPFRHFKSNFKNIGLGIGTELNYGSNSNFHQRFELIWYRNQAIGNGLLFQSQAIWRPTIGNDAFTEVKLGAGYLLSKRPVDSFQLQQGEWKRVGKRGKGIFCVPLGFGIGYKLTASNYQISPIVGYQAMALLKYNRSLPLVPETLLSTGLLIQNQ